MWLCLYSGITALGHMGGAAYSISAAGSATELRSEQALLTKLSWELIAGDQIWPKRISRELGIGLYSWAPFTILVNQPHTCFQLHTSSPTQSPNLCIVNQSCCVSAAISPELETERGCAGREESCSAALWLIYEATFCGCGRWRPIRPWARVSPGVFVFRGVSGARWCFTMGLMKSSSASNTQAMRWALNARLSRLCHQKFAFASIYFSKMVLCRKILDGTHVEI